MRLTKCSSCNKHMYSDTNLCPHCAKTNKNKPTIFNSDETIYGVTMVDVLSRPQPPKPSLLQKHTIKHTFQTPSCTLHSVMSPSQDHHTALIIPEKFRTHNTLKQVYTELLPFWEQPYITGIAPLIEYDIKHAAV